MLLLREYIESCRVSKAELKQNGGERKEGGKRWAKLERNQGENGRWSRRKLLNQPGRLRAAITRQGNSWSPAKLLQQHLSFCWNIYPREFHKATSTTRSVLVPCFSKIADTLKPFVISLSSVLARQMEYFTTVSVYNADIQRFSDLCRTQRVSLIYCWIGNSDKLATPRLINWKWY